MSDSESNEIVNKIINKGSSSASELEKPKSDGRKKPRSQKQIDATNKLVALRREQRQKKKDEKEAEKKKEFKKAVKNEVKKKKPVVLSDSESSSSEEDETPVKTYKTRSRSKKTKSVIHHNYYGGYYNKDQENKPQIKPEPTVEKATTKPLAPVKKPIKLTFL